MSRGRKSLFAAALLVLALSLVYSLASGRCAAFGEAFDLPSWRCVPASPPPINLQRDLHRT